MENTDTETVEPVEIESTDTPETESEAHLSLRDQLEKSFEAVEEKVSEKKEVSDTESTEKFKARSIPSKENAEPVTAPQSLSAEERKLFSTLPREVQEKWTERELKREKDLNQKFQEAAQIRRYHEDIERVVAPHRQKLALSGVNTAQAIDQLFAAQNLLDADPVEGLKWLAKSYGIDPSQLVPRQQERLDPAIQSVSERISQMEARANAQEQQRAEAEITQLEAHVQSFMNEKDKTGNLLRPHFEKIMTQLEPVVRQIRTTNPKMSNTEVLQTAYDQAVWANPEVRQALIQKEKEAEAATRVQEAKAKAAKARRAGVSIKGAPGQTVNGNTQGKSLRDTITELMGEKGY